MIPQGGAVMRQLPASRHWERHENKSLSLLQDANITKETDTAKVSNTFDCNGLSNISEGRVMPPMANHLPL